MLYKVVLTVQRVMYVLCKLRTFRFSLSFHLNGPLNEGIKLFRAIEYDVAPVNLSLNQFQTIRVSALIESLLSLAC